MSRTEIPQTWLDAHAHAAVTLFRHGRTLDAERLVERVQVVGHFNAGTVHTTVALTHSAAALADFAEALGRLVDPGAHPNDMALVFTDADTGETVDPSIFLTDVDGLAAVWASRTVMGAATHGDVHAFAELVAGWTTPEGIGNAVAHLCRLVQAVAPLVALQIDRDNLADLERGLSGQRATYAADCVDECANTWLRMTYRETRDLAAAEHVLDTGHAVTWETLWD